MIEGYFEVSPEQAMEAARKFCDFPSGLNKLLEGASSVDPAMRAAMIARAGDENIDYFKSVCPKAESVFKGLGNVPSEQRTGWLYDQCGFEKLGMIDRSEIAKTGLHEIWVGAMVYGWMAEKNVPEAKRFVRHMMALE